MTALLILNCGCQSDLQGFEVELPSRLRPGSPVVVTGLPLSGRALWLWTETGQKVLVALDTNDLGRDGVTGHVDSQSTLAIGARLTKACLGLGQGGDDRCVALSKGVPWVGGQWSDAPLEIQSNSPWSHGQRLALHLSDVPLPGEGVAWVETEVQRSDVTLPLSTTQVLSTSFPESSHGVWVTPKWLGSKLGSAKVRHRLMIQTITSIMHQSQWSAWATVEIQAPKRQSSGSAIMQRGRLSQALRFDEGAIAIAPRWLSGISWVPLGTWSSPQGKTLASWGPGDAKLTGLPLWSKGSVVGLPSSRWWIGGWNELAGATFNGRVGWRLVGPDGVQFIEEQAPLSLTMNPSIQVVHVMFDYAAEVGLAQWGLASAAPTIRTRVIDLVRSHFEGFVIEVTGELMQPNLFEYVRVAVLDRDPNALGLLGNEPSRGKDVGNRTLDEDLSGARDHGGAGAGQPPYGGVFLESMLLFSPTLNPGGSTVDTRFDEIFGAFCPLLAGKPAVANDPKAAMAIETLSQLIASTISHELGHALGLAAASGFHHAADNPGWRMDAGVARPFAERANLPGSAGERWGPIDAAALEQSLGALP